MGPFQFHQFSVKESRIGCKNKTTLPIVEGSIKVGFNKWLQNHMVYKIGTDFSTGSSLYTLRLEHVDMDHNLNTACYEGIINCNFGSRNDDYAWHNCHFSTKELRFGDQFSICTDSLPRIDGSLNSPITSIYH